MRWRVRDKRGEFVEARGCSRVDRIATPPEKKIKMESDDGERVHTLLLSVQLEQIRTAFEKTFVCK